jgi:hypothetical protein
VSQEIGESREQWGKDVWAQAEDFASKVQSDGRPFYVVFAAKADAGREATFRQTFKAYYQRPPLILGLLVWQVDKDKGLFEFVPELSSPPDIPVDPSLLSDKASDASPRVAEQGEKLKVLLS